MARAVQSERRNFLAGSAVQKFQAVTVGASDGAVVPTSTNAQFIVGTAAHDAKANEAVAV